MSEKFARLSHVDDPTKFIMSEESTHTIIECYSFVSPRSLYSNTCKWKQGWS